MTKKFYGICKIVNGQIVWPTADAQRWVSFKKLFDGQFVMITGGQVERLRTDDQHELYRVRNEVISRATGYTTRELHHRFFKACGLGVFRDEGAEPTTAFEVAQKFFRLSANEITRSQASQLMAAQQELVDEINLLSDDPAEHITLPEGRVTKKLREKYLQA